MNKYLIFGNSWISSILSSRSHKHYGYSEQQSCEWRCSTTMWLTSVHFCHSFCSGNHLQRVVKRIESKQWNCKPFASQMTFSNLKLLMTPTWGVWGNENAQTRVRMRMWLTMCFFSNQQHMQVSDYMKYQLGLTLFITESTFGFFLEVNHEISNCIFDT